MPPPRTIPPTEVAKICLGVTRRFGLNKCLECAKALAAALKEAGAAGEIVELKAQGATRGFIVMKDPKFAIPFPAGAGNEAISTNGKHYGVRLNGKIYCTVFRGGIRAADWEGQFDCDAHKFSVTVASRF